MTTDRPEPAQPTPRVLVTGATGYIGGRLVPRLLERELSVRCMVRDPGRIAADRFPGAEVITGDALRPSTLGPALVGIDVAYYLIHAMAAGQRGFRDRDLAAARAFGEAARAAGVRRIIYLGGLGAAQGISEHLRSRHETGDALRASGVPVTELRAAIVVGSGSISFEMLRSLVERIPLLVAPRWVQTRCQPIAIRDVLAYLVASATEPRALGRTIEIGGADVLTYSEMMLRYARARGLRRRVVEVPVLTPWLSSLWVDLVTPIPAAFARPLIQGLASEVIVRDDAARDVFPEIRPIGYDEAVRLALARVGANAVETAWSGATASAFERGPTPVHLDSVEGMIVERRERLVAAPAETVYGVLAGLGGARGWLYGDLLWRARGLLDRLVGGVGMRRGRRDPDRLRPGDAVDFWRVLAVEEGRRIRLGAEMRLPGRAWLELRAQPAPDRKRSLLQVEASFEPKGLLGLTYWYALYPVHRLLFAGMVKAIAARAEATAEATGAAAGGRSPVATPRDAATSPEAA